MEEKVKQKNIIIISKDPSLCNNWAGGKCYYPNGWRKSEADERKLPDCKCKPHGNIMCDKCEPDTVLKESRANYFEES